MTNDVVGFVTERGGASTLLTFVPKTVSDAAIRAGGVTLSGIAGTPLMQALVGTFTYEGGPVPADQFFAKVDWGDGTIEDLPASAIAAVGGSASGLVYSVTAGHTYRNPGTYPVGVVISSIYNSVALAGSAAFIAPSLVLQVPPLAAKAGAVIDNAVVARFVGQGDLQPATSYFALINWGDGTPLVPGTIAVINGSYAVLGTHVYANPGAYTLGVTLTENLAGAAAATGSVQVAPADPPVEVPPPPPVDPPAQSRSSSRSPASSTRRATPASPTPTGSRT